MLPIIQSGSIKCNGKNTEPVNQYPQQEEINLTYIINNDFTAVNENKTLVAIIENLCNMDSTFSKMYY